MMDIVERLESRARIARIAKEPNYAKLSEEAASEIRLLRSLLRRIDNVITWETTPLGRDFQEEVEAAIGTAEKL